MEGGVDEVGPVGGFASVVSAFVEDGETGATGFNVAGAG